MNVPTGVWPSISPAIHPSRRLKAPVYTYSAVNLNRGRLEVDKGVYGGLGLGALPIPIFSQKLLHIQNLNDATLQWAYKVACSFPGL